MHKIYKPETEFDKLSFPTRLIFEALLVNIEQCEKDPEKKLLELGKLLLDWGFSPSKR